MFLLFRKRILHYRDTGRQVPDGRVAANDYTQLRERAASEVTWRPAQEFLSAITAQHKLQPPPQLAILKTGCVAQSKHG